MRYRYVEFTRYLALDGVAAKPIQNLADIEGTPDAIGIVFAGGKRVPWGTIAYALEETAEVAYRPLPAMAGHLTITQEMVDGELMKDGWTRGPDGRLQPPAAPIKQPGPRPKR